MRIVRSAWILLAVFGVALGFFVASQQVLQITSCEVDPFVGTGFINSDDCFSSIAQYYGSSTILTLAVPPLMCLIPAIAPRTWISWSVAGVLSVGSVLAIFSATPELAIVAFYLPLSLAAILLAATHRGLGGIESSILRMRTTRAQPTNL